MRSMRDGEHWVIRAPGQAEPLATRAVVAASMVSRMVGLLGHRLLQEGEGMVILACQSIHTFFMRFAIDVVFTDGTWRVLRIHEGVRPWRMTTPVWGAAAAIELPSGTAGKCRLHVGDRLLFTRADAQNRLDTR